MRIFQTLSSLAKNITLGDLKTAKNTLVGQNKTITISPQLSSISSYATNAMYYLPVLVSENVSKNTAALMIKNAEREYANFLRAVFAMQPVIELENNDMASVANYLHRFHQNISGANTPLQIQLNSAADEAWVTITAPPLNESQRLLALEYARRDAMLEAGGMDRISSIMRSADISQGSGTEGTIINSGPEGRLTSAKMSGGNVITPADLKALSKMDPTYIIVEVTAIIKTNDGASKDQQQQTHKQSFKIPLAVKAQLHVVESQETMQYIIDSLDKRGVLNGLIRWTTGEMVSLADILFGFSKIKRKVADRDKNINRWANIIEERKRLSQMSTATMGKRVFLPNTTILLTMDEVREMELRSGYSLLEPRVGSRVIKDYFLLGIIVVDDMLDTAYILYDGFSEYAEYPYSMMMRENETSDREIKNLLRALGR